MQVMPGDKIGVEEEYVAAENTFVDDDGSIRATIAGTIVMNQGRISVINDKHNVKRFKRGMMVIGSVSDDVKSVMFVKLDNVRVNGAEYLALKDGKIITGRRRPMRGGFSRERERGRDMDSGGRDAEPRGKQCSVGDVILAKIGFEELDAFTLELDDANAGVVYAECEMCSSHLEANAGVPGTLSCPACKHREQRKISALYGKPQEIIKLFV